MYMSLPVETRKLYMSYHYITFLPYSAMVTKAININLIIQFSTLTQINFYFKEIQHEQKKIFNALILFNLQAQIWTRRTIKWPQVDQFYIQIERILEWVRNLANCRALACPSLVLRLALCLIGTLSTIQAGVLFVCQTKSRARNIWSKMRIYYKRK